MQREINYRGQRVDTKEWVYGYLFGIWERRYILWGATNDIPNMIEVIPETVGQYTGLKDKNGKEIYEGDIIQHLYEYSDELDRYICERCDDVESVIGGYQFRGINNTAGYIAVCDTASDNSGEFCIEVIGNIHDNPELLTQPTTDTH